MSNNKHPITPPPELVQQWWAQETYDPFGVAISNLATQAARWGSDQELEACVEWLEAEGRVGYAAQLRAARRPKSLSLKEQALETLLSMQIEPVVIDGINVNADVMSKYDIIRRALEQLPD